jgi:hypothetical protein
MREVRDLRNIVNNLQLLRDKRDSGVKSCGKYLIIRGVVRSNRNYPIIDLKLSQPF